MEKTIIMKLDEADVYDMYYARLEMVRKNFNWDCDEDLFDKFVDYVCSLDSVPTPKVAVDNFIVNGSIYNKDCPRTGNWNTALGTTSVRKLCSTQITSLV